MIYIEKAERKAGMARIMCPNCGRAVDHIAINRDSRISGLEFHCRQCKGFFSVRTE